MGFDPLTIGVGLAAGSSVLGAVGQDRANARNTRAQQAALAAQQQRQAQIDSFIKPYLNSGANPFASMLMSMLNGGTPGQPGFTMPSAVPSFTYNPAAIDPSVVTGSQGFNTGQDAIMQMLNRGITLPTDASLGEDLRSAGQKFDTSDLFASLAPQDARMLDEQVAQLRGSFGTLGQRFGTAAGQQERQLRGNFIQDVAARNAGIAQTSFENAANRNLQGLTLQAQREQFLSQLPLMQGQYQLSLADALQRGGLDQAGLLAQIAQANAASQNAAGQFNAGQQAQTSQFNAGQSQLWNQFLSSVIGQAGGLQQNQQSLNAQLLAIMAGQQPAGVVQQQPSPYPGAIGDIGQLLMFLPFLNSLRKPATPA